MSSTHHNHRHDHPHGDPHAGHAHAPATHSAPADACCDSGAHATATAAPRAAAPGELRLRIPAMDCAVEEGEIRRVLEAFGDIRRLHFDLPARTLGIDAPTASWDPLGSAIQAAGFPAERLAAR